MSISPSLGVEGLGCPTRSVQAAITRVVPPQSLLPSLLPPPRVTIADPCELRVNIDCNIVMGREVENDRPSGRTFCDVNSCR